MNFRAMAATAMLVCAGISGAHASTVLTLDEAVAIALRDNRDVALQAAEVRKAQQVLAQSHAALLPTFSLSGGWTYTRGYYGKNVGQTTAQASARQDLYKGGRTVATIRRSQAGVSVAQALLDRTRLELVFKVKKAFDTVILARQYAQLNDYIVANTRRHLDTVNARYAVGESSEAEVLQLKQALASVEQAAVESHNQVESARALLRNALAVAQTVDIEPEGTFVYDPREISYEEGFSRALARRPEFKQFEAQQEAARNAVTLAKADTRPSVYASWDYYSRSHTASVSGVSRNWNDYQVMGFAVSWPVFDGWAARAKVEQALIDLKQAGLAREKTQADVALEVKNAYLSLGSALASVRASAAERQRYEYEAQQARRRQTQGVISALDVDDALLRLGVARFNEQQALYDYAVARVAMDKAMGGA